MPTDVQVLPVRMYETDDHVMLAAPMPGLEPADISIRTDGRRVTIRGELRGPHQRALPLLMAEWSVGPYAREVELRTPVDGRLTNATFGNGVLVLSMPKAAAGTSGVPAEIVLDTLASTRGRHVGHVGRAITPSSTGEHQRDTQRKDEPRRAESAPAETEPRPASGYAHVNIWRLRAEDDAVDDTSTATAIAERLERQPGFRSYIVVRTGEHEIVAVTVFDSASQIQAALGQVEDVVAGRVRRVAATGPDRRKGPVVLHMAA